MKIFIGWIFFVSIIIYIFSLFRFLRRMRNEFGGYWESIGRPSVSDPNGQLIILKKIFIPNQMPAKVYERHRITINLIRYSGVIFLLAFAAIWLMTLAGKYS